MSKLSKPMSDALSDLASYGIFQSGTRPQTITGLVNRGLVIKTGDDDYSLTDDGYAELGTAKPGVAETIVGEVTPLAEWEVELLGINPDRPYAVQQQRNGAWFTVPGMEYRTWGTASTKRHQREHIYSDVICRVFDTIENRVCA